MGVVADWIGEFVRKSLELAFVGEKLFREWVVGGFAGEERFEVRKYLGENTLCRNISELRAVAGESGLGSLYI